jgi:hypothetical protein
LKKMFSACQTASEEGFVVELVAEDDGEGLNGLAHVPLCEAEHRAGIDPAAQVRGHLHVRDEAFADALVQLLPEARHDLGVAARVRSERVLARVLDVPVAM